MLFVVFMYYGKGKKRIKERVYKCIATRITFQPVNEICIIHLEKNK